MQATASASPARLAKDLAAFLAVIHRTSQTEWFQTVSELDISLTQLKALHMMSAKPELAVKDVAAALTLSFPAASRAIDGLVNKGLVARRECADDRRSRLVSLTAEGRKVLEHVYEARLAGLRDFVKRLDDGERAALQQALDVLVAER